MPQLGLGLGLHKNSFVQTPYQALIASASAYWTPDKADGLSSGINAPFTNPLIDNKGVVGKNLFDQMAVIDGFIVSQTTGNLDVSVNYCTSTFIPVMQNTQYARTVITSTKRVAFYDSNKSFISGGIFDVFTTPTNCVFVRTSCLITEKNTFQLELGSVATAYAPYGKANCLLQAFAGTSADGYTVQTINGKTNTFLNLDGVNSFGSFANMDVLNPVGSDDFAQLVVFRPDDTTTRYFGLSRNDSDGSTVQFGLINGSSGNLLYVVNSVLTSIQPVDNNFKWVLYGRIGGNRFAIVDGIEKHNSTYLASVVTRANTQLGCRSNSADGTVKSTFGKGLQGDMFFWKGAQGTIDKAKIVDLAKRAMKSKYNLGV